MGGIRQLQKDRVTGVISFLKDTTSTIPASLLTANQIAAEYASTVAPTLGVSSAYGTAVNSAPGAGFAQIEPTEIAVTWAGTFSAETANIKVVATFSDSTTATFTAAGVTATGSQSFFTNDFATLVSTGKKITNLATSATTTKATSTLVTVSVVITGIQNQ